MALGRIEELTVAGDGTEGVVVSDVELGEPPVKQPRAKG